MSKKSIYYIILIENVMCNLNFVLIFFLLSVKYIIPIFSSSVSKLVNFFFQLNNRYACIAFKIINKNNKYINKK